MSDKYTEQKFKELEEQIRILKENSQRAQVYTNAYAGVAVVEKIPVMSEQRYKEKVAELDAKNPKLLKKEPSYIFDDKGNVIGFNETVIFAKPNGYEAYGYIRDVEDGRRQFIIRMNHVEDISNNRIVPGMPITGYERDKAKIYPISIESKDISLFRVPETVQEADEVFELKQKVGIL